MLARVTLTTGCGLIGALILLRRRLLLGSSALTRGRRLLVGALILLCRRLLLGSAALAAGRRLLTSALVLLRWCLLACVALARRSTTLARRGAALRANLVRQSERANGLIVDTAASLEALLPLECHQRLSCPRTKPSVRSADIEPLLV